MDRTKLLPPAAKRRRHSPATRLLRLLIPCAAIAGAVVYIGERTELGAISTAAGALHWTTGATVLGLFLLGTLIAGLRLWFIAGDIGAPIRFSDANVAVSVGSLAGAIFFQIIGQLVARSTFLARRGTPVAAVLIMFGYERAAAAIVSVSLAAVGATFLFGTLSFDLHNGGRQFLKILVAGFAAICAGAYLGWGRCAIGRLPEIWHVAFLGRGARSVAITVSTQLCSVAAYVVAAHALAPELDVFKVAAAATVVMLAASLPISFAGWGIRELSSVLALGAIGLPNEKAVVVALLIGAASLAALIIVLLVSLVTSRAGSRRPVGMQLNYAPQPRNFGKLLVWTLSISTATLIFFQVHVPTTHGAELNVNLADPFAITGGALFVLNAIRLRKWPSWRLPGFNGSLLAATIAITVGLLVGWGSIGWTPWALTSKYLGWFILLSYGATGALLVSTDGRFGYHVLLRTFIAAGAAVAVVEIALIAFRCLGATIDPTLAPIRASGLAANANAFALQMAFVTCAAVTLIRSSKLLVPLISIALVAVWLSGSRAGIGAEGVVLVAAAMLLPNQRRSIAYALLLAAGIGAILMLSSQQELLGLRASPSSDAEHWQTIVGALEIFMNHPLFGVGLGVFAEHWRIEHGSVLIIHSTPLWLLAEFGIFGAAVIALPFVRSVLWAFPRAVEGQEVAIVTLLCCIAFASMALVHEMLYQRAIWLLIGASIASGAGRRDGTWSLFRSIGLVGRQLPGAIQRLPHRVMKLAAAAAHRHFPSDRPEHGVYC